MLVVVFQRQSVFRAYDPVEICNRLIRQEVRRAAGKGVFREIGGDWIDQGAGVGRRKQKLAIGELVIEQTVRNGTDVAGGRADRRVDGRSEVAVDESRQGCGAPVIRATWWNRDARAADLRVRIVNVLVGDKAEEFVLNNGRAQRTARRVAVQPRHFIAGGNIRVGVVEEGSRV